MSVLVRTIVGVVATLSALAGSARSAPPTLSHLFPAGGQRGAKVAVRCTGTFSWPAKVWAPGLDVVAAKESGTLEVTVPKDLAADRVWIRLYNDEGASAAMPFLIDHLKETEEKEPNDAPRAAQMLADANVVVNGVLAKSADVDCFAVRLNTGQTLVAIVDANDRLGSPMDAILQITTPDGHVVAENNDDVHLDPRLTFKAAKSGDYIVRVFAFASEPNASIQLSGGAKFVYRLTLTTGPFVTHAMPMSGSLTKAGDIEVFGWNIPPKTKATAVPYGGPSKVADHHEREALTLLRLPRDSRLGFAFAPNLAGAARVRLTPHDAIIAAHAADPKKPMKLTLPSCVTGRLLAPHQIDAFLVPLKKGQQLIAAAETNSLGFPLDPALKLFDPDKTVVASAADIGPNREAMLTHAALKDGDYRLEISDRFRQGGERSLYRLTVRLEEADFEMSIATDAVTVMPDKAAELPIKIQRRGTSVGPMTIQIAGLPDGVTAPPVTSEPTGPTASTVTMKLSSTGTAYSGPIQIAGKVSQPKTIERLAQTPSRLGAVFESVWLTVIAKK